MDVEKTMEVVRDQLAPAAALQLRTGSRLGRAIWLAIVGRAGSESDAGKRMSVSTKKLPSSYPRNS